MKLLLKIILLIFLLTLIIQAYFFIQICWWTTHNPTSTSFMRHQLAQLQEKKPQAKLQQQWIAYERISNQLKRAIIAAEDANFTEHEGVDWHAMQKAFEKNTKKGRVVSGGSTITQQLAKNLFLSGQRSYWRKAQEFIITLMLETMMGKERIFEIYLNVVEWGNGVYGAEAAARHYYGISAANLNAYQAARLAVMLPNPRYYDAHPNSTYLQKRTNLIMRRMNASALP
jgi:monofunctional biosynthetic peptidoglycan transglycosylase